MLRGSRENGPFFLVSLLFCPRPQKILRWWWQGSSGALEHLKSWEKELPTLIWEAVVSRAYSPIAIATSLVLLLPGPRFGCPCESTQQSKEIKAPTFWLKRWEVEPQKVLRRSWRRGPRGIADGFLSIPIRLTCMNLTLSNIPKTLKTELWERPLPPSQTDHRVLTWEDTE